MRGPSSFCVALLVYLHTILYTVLTLTLRACVCVCLALSLFLSFSLFRYRSLWPQYFAGADAVIYVVDCSSEGQERLQETKDECAALLSHPLLSERAVLLVVANRSAETQEGKNDGSALPIAAQLSVGARRAAAGGKGKQEPALSSRELGEALGLGLGGTGMSGGGGGGERGATQKSRKVRVMPVSCVEQDKAMQESFAWVIEQCQQVALEAAQAQKK